MGEYICTGKGATAGYQGALGLGDTAKGYRIRSPRTRAIGTIPLSLG